MLLRATLQFIIMYSDWHKQLQQYISLVVCGLSDGISHVGTARLLSAQHLQKFPTLLYIQTEKTQSPVKTHALSNTINNKFDNNYYLAFRLA